MNEADKCGLVTLICRFNMDNGGLHMINNSEYYYCYSTNLFKFLKMEKKISYNCSGLHEVTMRKFWQFKRDDELNQALADYKKNGINLGAR
jgi:hypothetical protein